MSTFYQQHSKSTSAVSFDSSRRLNRSPSSSQEQQLPPSSPGGPPMQAMMVPGVVVPSLERPNPDSPFSDWEAYIVRQAQSWSDQKNLPPLPNASSSSPNPTRITWADQIRKSTPQASPYVYTKARDRVASPPPQGPPPSNPLGLLRRSSSDLLRSSPPRFKNTPSPPSSGRPSISSPMTTMSSMAIGSPSSPSTISSLPTSSFSPLANGDKALPVHAPTARRWPEIGTLPRTGRDSPSASPKSSPVLPSVTLPPLTFSSEAFSPLPDFSKRASVTSNSSGRAPGPSEILTAFPISSLMVGGDEKAPAPPSIADTYSVHSRSSSWASSIDLDPAIICTPPLSHEEWSDPPRASRPNFLQEFGLDEDSEESDTEFSAEAKQEGSASNSATKNEQSSVKSSRMDSAEVPVFQRMEAELDQAERQALHILPSPRPSHTSEHELSVDSSPILPRLDLSSLPREKDEAKKVRTKMVSPLSLKKAFSKKNKGSLSPQSHSNGSVDSFRRGSASGSDTDPRTPEDRSPIIHAPIEGGKQFESNWSTDHGLTTQTASPLLPQVIVEEQEQHDKQPAAASESAVSLPIVYSPSSNPMELSPSRDVPASIISSTSSNSSRRKPAAIPGLSKPSKRASDAGAAPTLDPHLARSSSRVSSAGSITSNSSQSGSNSVIRRGSRRSGRNRIMGAMPTFGEFAAGLTVPADRRLSNRSLSSDGSVDSHSNASNSSSFNKVGGSDENSAIPPTPIAVKGVLRKRSGSEDSFSSTSQRKEVSFELPKLEGIEPVSEDEEGEEEELEHEKKQRGMLYLPPMKLQDLKKQDLPASTTKESSVEAVDTVAKAGPGQDDLDIATFLNTFGKNIMRVESQGLSDTFDLGSSERPKREDWDSFTAYFMAYATTILSSYNDFGATKVYAPKKDMAEHGEEQQKREVEALRKLLNANPLYRSTAQTLFKIVNFDQPLISVGAASIYTFCWLKGRLIALSLAGLAAGVLGAQSQGVSEGSSNDEDLERALLRISTLLSLSSAGSSETNQKVRNLLLWRSPKASLRCVGILLGLAFLAWIVDGISVVRVSGFLLGVLMFVWMPIVLHQPKWAPDWITHQTGLLDTLLYDVPNDAQHAITVLRRRAANGQPLLLVQKPNDQVTTTSSTSIELNASMFDGRLSSFELSQVSNVINGSHKATYKGSQGHLIILPSKVIFRSPASSLADQVEESLQHQLLKESQQATKSKVEICFEARLEKITVLQKMKDHGNAEDSLTIGLKNGQTYLLENVYLRDVAFNKLLGLSPQQWQ